MGASMNIECPMCRTSRGDFDPVIRYEKDAEVRLCLTCGAGYKVRRDSEKIEEATI
jgi:uncharacterized Zn finger protein